MKPVECEAAEDVAPGLIASFQWRFHGSKTNMWSLSTTNTNIDNLVFHKSVAPGDLI